MPDRPDPESLRPEDVPIHGQGLNAFAHRFDGYRHFGGSDAAVARTNSIRAQWADDGALPASVDDLRACLWVEARRERFVEFDDVVPVKAPDGTVVHEPDPSRETLGRRVQEHFKRALATRIVGLLRGTTPATLMDSQAIRDYLHDCTLETHSDRALSISSAVVRAECAGVPVVAVGNDQPLGVQITGLLDALHFHRERYGGNGPLRYVVGRRSNQQEMDELLAALSGLVEDLRGTLDLTIEVDFTPVSLKAASLQALGERWLEQMRIRDGRLEALPDTAGELLRLVDDPSFRWHLPLNASEFSGRIDGLQVCTLSLDGLRGRLAIGSDGGRDNRLVRERFRAAAGRRDQVPINPDDLLEAARILIALVEDRRSGPLQAAEPEHLLEARILRGALPVPHPDGGTLVPVSTMGQFPAAYSERGNARFIDAVLRAEGTPWVIELKDLPAGRGRYLRHGIAQAVLYRRFLRDARGIHPYFSDLVPPVEPRLTRSAVAFPAFGSSRSGAKRLAELRGLAALFDVDVIELETTIDDTPRDLPEPLLPADPSEGDTPDYRVVVRFATQPDNPKAMADEIRLTLEAHELAIVEDEDIEITLRVWATGTFEAARVALDRVQSAIGESQFVAPELLSIDVEGIYSWAEDEDAQADQ